MSFNDDDFADFQNCSIEDDKTTGEANCLANDQDDEFADFQDAKFIVNNSTDNKENDRSSIEPNSKSNCNENSKIELILKDAFPSLESNSNETDDNQSVILKDLFTDGYKKSLWTQIQNLEESPSLKLKWNQTKSFQNFLSALKINPKSMLTNSHVPVFASTITFGLLEPTKLNNTDTEHIASNTNLNKETNSTNSINSTNTDYHSTKNDKVCSQLEISSSNNRNLAYDNDLNRFDSLNLKQKDKNEQPNGLIKPVSTSNKVDSAKKLSDNQKRKEESNNKILDELPILNFMRSDQLMFH